MSFGVEESSSELVAGFEPAWKAYISGIVRVDRGIGWCSAVASFTLNGVARFRRVQWKIE